MYIGVGGIMLRNKLAIGLLSLMIAMMPVTTSAQAGWGVWADDVYAQRISPLAYVLDYDAETKIVRINFFEPDVYEPSWMAGLVFIELVFNADVKPNAVSAVYINETNVMDMLKNFTMTDNVHYWMEGDGTYYDASYLLAFVYIYPNHTIINEHVIGGGLQYWDRPWIGGPNDTSPQNDPSFSLSSDSNEFSLSDTLSDTYVDLDFNENVTTTTTTTPNNNNLLLIVGSVGIVIMAIVIVIWYGRRTA